MCENTENGNSEETGIRRENLLFPGKPCITLHHRGRRGSNPNYRIQKALQHQELQAARSLTYRPAYRFWPKPCRIWPKSPEHGSDSPTSFARPSWQWLGLLEAKRNCTPSPSPRSQGLHGNVGLCARSVVSAVRSVHRCGRAAQPRKQWQIRSRRPCGSTTSRGAWGIWPNSSTRSHRSSTRPLRLKRRGMDDHSRAHEATEGRPRTPERRADRQTRAAAR